VTSVNTRCLCIRPTLCETSLSKKKKKKKKEKKEKERNRLLTFDKVPFRNFGGDASYAVMYMTGLKERGCSRAHEAVTSS
jgi:hypothetical protein